MHITLNGQAREISAAQSLRELVRQFCPNTTSIIAEVNGTIVKNPQWDIVMIKETDRIELIHFVGGG